MVSQRQQLARKKFKAEHPDLFPKPESTPPKDPDNKKKKKPKKLLKPKKGDSKEPFKRSFRKHPLRVPGMKPGDSCFICKAKDHIAKSCPEKAEWEKNKICLRCRQRGQRAKNCPQVKDGANDSKICYNCGETGHALSKCPQPLQDGGTKFAECFVCKGRGHLSKDCPKNVHGIYPKGGCCKICGGVTHLAKDCPDKGRKESAAAYASTNTATEGGPRNQVTKLVSGDDLEDDFIADEAPNVEKPSKSKNVNEKPKKVPEVVKFYKKFISQHVLGIICFHFLSHVLN